MFFGISHREVELTHALKVPQACQVLDSSAHNDCSVPSLAEDWVISKLL